jgi:hypothetical protein
MRREQLTEKILDIKREKGWTWAHICTEIGGVAPASARQEIPLAPAGVWL